MALFKPFIYHDPTAPTFHKPSLAIHRSSPSKDCQTFRYVRTTDILHPPLPHDLPLPTHSLYIKAAISVPCDSDGLHPPPLLLSPIPPSSLGPSTVLRITECSSFFLLSNVPLHVFSSICHYSPNTLPFLVSPSLSTPHSSPRSHGSMLYVILPPLLSDSPVSNPTLLSSETISFHHLCHPAPTLFWPPIPAQLSQWCRPVSHAP